MSFDEIQIRMLQLGVDRDWLAKECDYSRSHIANILAPKGNPAAKTDKALRRMWEALDREEQRQKAEHFKPATLTNTVTLTPTVEQFDRWMRAAYRHHDSFDAWAKAGLDRLAEQEPSLKVAEDETSYGTKKK